MKNVIVQPCSDDRMDEERRTSSLSNLHTELILRRWNRFTPELLLICLSIDRLIKYNRDFFHSQWSVYHGLLFSAGSLLHERYTGSSESDSQSSSPCV